ncbi:sugar phosphate isomerase/epimerase family protein [Pelagicoccus sp. SDUM812002]|uniref:sugar phosphate isomerase/epimerase family protein n=1 Tax=Pelagicoccus sp. SDUM812002 TaxID=3041266 RepID=UPI00280CCBF8|nr:sugar phosphate isomerase/epimerase family protein [Pelagicoccus sp. SDUM812002]MDQ8184635.1 sugar phosphate isomerase/epimerase [Pelagicoccus sp. SDUM812002]
MPKLGFNLLNWTASVTEEHYPHIERLKAIGYDGIEIYNGNADTAAYTHLGAHLKEIGMDITNVTTLDAEANPVSPNASVRSKALDKIKWNIDRCADCGSNILAGPLHSAFATFTRSNIEEDEYKRSAEVLYSAAEYSKQANVILCPEALNRFECYLCNTMEQLVKLVELTGHSHVKGMFDTHHANIEEKSLPDAIKTIAPHLAHVHLSENDRGAPGSGHIDFLETIKTLKSVGYDGWMTIEAFSRADPDFANAINVWREFSLAWDIAESGYAHLSKCISAAGH